MYTNILFIYKLLSKLFLRTIDRSITIKNHLASKYLRCQVSSLGSIHTCWPIYIEGGQYMTINDGFNSGPGLRIECIDTYACCSYKPTLTIGKNVVLNYRCHIGCINSITIGDNVLIGSNVLITDHSHGRFEEESMFVPWNKKELYSKGPVIIEDNVWIGENVSILGGVTIGKGCVIGANAVVLHDIGPYSMAVGNPARVIRHLSC